MRTLALVVMLMAFLPGMTPRAFAQQPEPPEPPVMAPMRMPPDFQGGSKKNPRPHPVFDAAKAQKRAQELAKLAGQVPGEIHEVSHGVLPKDLIQKLKTIEKLSKQLRKQVVQ